MSSKSLIGTIQHSDTDEGRASTFLCEPLTLAMSIRSPLSEAKCTECGQVTLTEDWQDVNYCASCGVAFDSADTDRDDHLAVGLMLSHDEVTQLDNGKEVTLTRSISNSQLLTVDLLRELS
ncbi:hypothetical protein C449_04710 [Halococcus saccharolyticus DSM 5350]|uniref:Uncharacterized protein n=1 Tax=Halococcus saccharolyticus DSM 5350 TaxID=1227455 RepID=M0MPB2_9EURY|nr:hypothetical protein C449_04710 [Halococcus saccharolyticus DSM 5350]